MNIVPSNEYLLVMPSGKVKGFDDYAMAKAYINNYYYYKTRRVEEVGAYDDLTNDFDDIVDTVLLTRSYVFICFPLFNSIAIILQSFVPAIIIGGFTSFDDRIVNAFGITVPSINSLMHLLYKVTDDFLDIMEG